MAHVEETLEKCLRIIETLDREMCLGGDPYTMMPGRQLVHDIQAAIQIVKHESVQVPKDVREAALMKQVAQMYLGEIKL